MCLLSFLKRYLNFIIISEVPTSREFILLILIYRAHHKNYKIMGTNMYNTFHQWYLCTNMQHIPRIMKTNVRIHHSIQYKKMKCRRFSLSTFWCVDVSACRRFGLSTFWALDVLVCRRFGLSTFRFVDVLVCRRFGLSTFWFVDVLTSYQWDDFYICLTICFHWTMKTMTYQTLKKSKQSIAINDSDYSMIQCSRIGNHIRYKVCFFFY